MANGPACRFRRSCRVRASGPRRFAFHCADTLDDGSEFGIDPEDSRYYEGIDLIDAAHPQRILAYDMNGKPLTVPPGGPLRLQPELRSAAGRQSSLRLAEELRRSRKGKIGPSWYVDETYVRVHGHWKYFYRAIDRDDALVDVMLTEHRNLAAAKRFFRLDGHRRNPRPGHDGRRRI